MKMSRFMTALTLLALVAVPVLWIQEQYIWAVVVMLTVATMLVQAACVDMPGTPGYDELEKDWHTPDDEPRRDL